MEGNYDLRNLIFIFSIMADVIKLKIIRFLII